MISFREATLQDVPTIVALLAADPLGAQREDATDPLPAAYARAYEAIDRDPNQELVVATLQGVVVGVLQITFIPSLTYRGSWRAQIEGVRVAQAVRSQGVGRSLVGHGIARAKDRGCHIVQLTTDKRRPEAVAFYQSLGFTPSHEGMKLRLG